MTDSDRTVWLLLSTTLVMLTLPGVALFYGGMVRKKNVLNTMGLPLLALVLVSILWLVGGDLLAVAPGGGTGARFGPVSPLLAYQMMSAALALALVAGALVERIHVSFFLLFGFLWS
ncbi:MAG: ammonium transporter, partial [Nitrospira sp.]|nr:ammonium transporter [Nitrospira sp.]